MKAADVMTRRVLTVTRDTPLEDAVRLMLQQRISGLPVLDEAGALAGILTEGDLLRRVETGTVKKRPHWLELLLPPGRLAAEYVHTHSHKVEDVMTAKVVAVAPDTPLETIVDTMKRARVKRVPVVENGLLVGIVSRADLLQTLAPPADEAPTPASDEEIRARLWAELEQSDWAPVKLISVEVRDGVVALKGSITGEWEREALRVAAENTPGVKAVEDHLVWFDPLSGTVIEPDEDEARAGKSRPTP